MNVKQVTKIYFSPTESTKRVVELIGAQIYGAQESLDLTDAIRRRPDYHFLENEVVLVGVPVYGGRVPATAVERLGKLHGHKTPVILVVTYGNRAYEDALAELRDVLVKQGFLPVAAAAVVTEHNIVRTIAAGRPDAADREKLMQFGHQVDAHLHRAESSSQMPEPQLPGNRPYRAYGGLPMKIKVGSACTECRVCIRRCPVQAISRTDAKVTDAERCIGCMRCMYVCPVGARKVSPLILAAAGHKLKKVCRDRKESEFML